MTIVQVFNKESDQAMYEGLIASGMSQHDAFVHVLDGKPAEYVDGHGKRIRTALLGKYVWLNLSVPNAKEKFIGIGMSRLIITIAAV